MKLNEFVKSVRDMEKLLPGCIYVEEPVEELLPVVAEIERLMLHDSGEATGLAWHKPTQQIVEVLEYANVGSGWIVKPQAGGSMFAADEASIQPLRR